jgi:osmotically-inducible protein OsmY
MKRHKIFLFLQMILAVACLGGCISLADVFDSKQEQDLSSQYDDAGIKTGITSALLRENATKANDVDVHCYRGHVFLVGEADKDFRRFALDSARNTQGVVHVTTHWFPDGTASTADDAALEAAIVQKMGFLASSPSSQVGIDAWGGNVVLTGILSSQSEINKAIATAKDTPGVKSVTSYLVPN